jgi:hypothetical protein
MLDALARIVDPEFKVKWPLSDEAKAIAAHSLRKMTNEDRRYDRRLGPPGRSRFGNSGSGLRGRHGTAIRAEWGWDDQA